MLSDEYGIDLALTDDGDLQVTPSGSLAFFDGPINCGQALILRLRTTPGELPMHPEYGSGLPALAGTKALDDTLAQAKVAVELRKALESDQRFLAARDLTVAAHPTDPSRLGIGFRLELTGGEVLDVSDAGEPRLDEIAVDDAQPTLADLAAAETDDAELFADLDDELPELAELLGDDDATTEAQDL